MTGFNMPPGCSESDIPGNRPEDDAWEKFIEEISNSGLTAKEARARWMNNTVERCEEMLIDSLREEIRKMKAVVEAAIELNSAMSEDAWKDEPRIGYAEVQINKYELHQFKEAVAALTEKSK